MTYGVTSTGFNKKDLDTIKTDIQDDLADETGNPKLNFLDSGVLGQVIGVFGDKLRELWDVALAAYSAAYPDSASGAALDAVAALTGAIRLPASESEVTLDQLNVDSGVTIPAGSIAAIGSDGERWVTTAAVTNSGGFQANVSVAAESENTGPINGNSGTIDTISTPVAGWKGNVGITGTATESFNFNNTDLEIYVDEGAKQTVTFPLPDPFTAAQAASEINSQTTGLTASDVGGQVRIVSDLVGTGSALKFGPVATSPATVLLGLPQDTLIKGFNSADATPGTNIETDPEFRLRREELLRQTGKATVEAIRASLRALDGVTQALVLENTTLVTDVDGLPGKSFECVVQGGVDQEIADDIWDSKPAGIEAHGSTSKTVTDSQGINHTIKFSRPTDVPIYIKLTASVDFAVYPTDGDTQIKTALVAKMAEQQVGDDVIALQFKCVPLDVAGVEDVTIFLIDDIDPPVGTTNVVIATRELASLDSADIDVTSVSI